MKEEIEVDCASHGHAKISVSRQWTEKLEISGLPSVLAAGKTEV